MSRALYVGLLDFSFLFFLSQALEAYQQAAERGSGTNKQSHEKVRNLQKMVRQQKAKAATVGGDGSVGVASVASASS